MHRSTRLGLGFAVLFALAIAVAAAPVGATPPDATSSDWNDSAIEWRSYEDGKAEIAATGKPGILVFYTTWCPHCHNYSRVFHAEEVVALAKQFVMIRVDRDAEPGISSRYAKNGNYIPRTLFLDAKGAVDWNHKGSNTGFPYYLDEHEYSELLALMHSFEATPASAE